MTTCISCSKPAAPNRARCPSCLSGAIATAQKAMARYRAMGICPDCKDPAEPGRPYCHSCREYRNALSRNRYKERRSHNLCGTCGKAASGALCDHCRAKNTRWQKKRIARSLRTLVLERDNNSCRLCGDKGLRLIAHHRNGAHVRTDIEALQNHPDNAMDNLITLCRKCHSDLTHLSRVLQFDLLIQLLHELR